MKDEICYRTKRNKIKTKYQIKFELIGSNMGLFHDNMKEYNKYLDNETEKIYNKQFEV